MDRQADQKPPPAKPPGGDKKPDIEARKSSWNTFPGLLTAIASIIVAVAGLIAALDNAGLIRPRATLTPTPTLTSTPTQTSTPTPTPTITLTPTQTDTPTTTQPPTNSPTPTENNPPLTSETPTPIPKNHFTPTPSPTSTLVIAPSLEFCMKKMNDSAVVRQGPDINTPVLGNVPSEACLNFDVRLPDDTWVRIAQSQPGPYQALAGGWVRSENITELKDIDHLDFYKPQDALEGLYCVTSYTGINVRECADITCPVVGSLRRGDCLIFNGRLADSSWLRVAPNQAGYTDLAGKWAASVYLVVKEFFTFVDPHDMLPYFQLLPVVSPPPTPGG
jgi:hypothetical protein